MIPRKPHHKRLERKTPIKRGTKRLRAVSRSTRAIERQQWQRELSAYWQEQGMPNYCEVQLIGCINIFLTLAHSKDRGDIYTKADFFQIVWACEKCHFHADRKMPKETRLELFKEIIARRENNANTS